MEGLDGYMDKQELQRVALEKHMYRIARLVNTTASDRTHTNTPRGNWRRYTLGCLIHGLHLPTHPSIHVSRTYLPRDNNYRKHHIRNATHKASMCVSLLCSGDSLQDKNLPSKTRVTRDAHSIRIMEQDDKGDCGHTPEWFTQERIEYRPSFDSH